MQHAAIEAQKLKPFRSSTGSTRNIGSVAKTNQKADCDKLPMASLSPVSRQSHTNERSETSGNNRMVAPSVGLRLATSEAAARAADWSKRGINH